MAIRTERADRPVTSIPLMGAEVVVTTHRTEDLDEEIFPSRVRQQLLQLATLKEGKGAQPIPYSVLTAEGGGFYLQGTWTIELQSPEAGVYKVEIINVHDATYGMQSVVARSKFDFRGTRTGHQPRQQITHELPDPANLATTPKHDLSQLLWARVISAAHTGLVGRL